MKDKITKRNRPSVEHSLRHSILPDGATTAPLCPACGSVIPKQNLVDPALAEKAREHMQRTGAPRVEVPCASQGECTCDKCGSAVDFVTGSISVFRTELAARVKIYTTA